MVGFLEFPSLELNGYIFLEAYVMHKGSLFDVYMNILVIKAWILVRIPLYRQG
jgi:hypothetical protein